MFESANALDGLNDEQRQAAAHPSGPLLVLAGAGTGKTRTLVARAAWLCEQGMQPGPYGRIRRYNQDSYHFSPHPRPLSPSGLREG